MRIVSLLVSFLFLGAAAAGLIPDIAYRNVAVVADGGRGGGHNTTMSGAHAQPSGSPTGGPVPSITGDIQSYLSTDSPGGPIQTSRSPHPISGGPRHTGTHSHRSGAPTGASGRPTSFPHSHTANATGTHAHHPTPPSGTMPSYGSGYHPTPSASHAHSANPSGHTSGSLSDTSVLPEPTTSNA